MKGLEVHFSSLIFTGFKVSSKHVHIPQLQMSNSTDSTSDDKCCRFNVPFKVLTKHVVQ